MRRRMNDARRRGATLVLVTTIGMILAILGLSMIELGYHARAIAAHDMKKVAARCAADAGLAEAFERMQQSLIRAHQDHTSFPGAIASVTDAALPGSTATYSYQVNYIGGAYQIVSTGTYGNEGSQTIHAVLDIASYADGIGIAEELVAQNNSTFGVLGTGKIKIRSNTDLANGMWFKNNARVEGEVWCGPGGDPYSVVETVDAIEETVSDGIGAASEIMVWPPVTVPDGLVTRTDYKITATMTLDPGGYAYYGNFSLSGGASSPTILYIEGNTTIYVQGILNLGNNARIVLRPNASLDLYIGESMICDNSAEISALPSASGNGIVRVFGLSGPAPTPTCDAINLKTKSSVSVAVYAPEADVRIHNGNSSDDATNAFVGALVGKSLTIDNDANFLFDTRFATVMIDNVLAYFVIDRWWEE